MTMSNRSRRQEAAREFVVAATATTLLMIATLTGCAAQPKSIPDASTARVIVRFAQGTPDPTDAAFLARLAESTGVTRIEPIRAMSGDAYVMTLVCPGPARDASTDPCDAAIARVAANGAVASIERDSKIRLK